MMNNNTNCPDYTDHLENAIDRAFPSGHIKAYQLAAQWAAIEIDATNEYLNCEGHY